jgi:hypothetical protein
MKNAAILASMKYDLGVVIKQVKFRRITNPPGVAELRCI